MPETRNGSFLHRLWLRLTRRACPRCKGRGYRPWGGALADVLGQTCWVCDGDGRKFKANPSAALRQAVEDAEQHPPRLREVSDGR
jgi:hypothetical protein